MNKSGLEEYIQAFFRKRNLNISQSAVLFLLHPDHLHEEQLEETDDGRILRNIDMILEQIAHNHEKYIEKEFRRKKRWWRSNYMINRSLRQQYIDETAIMPVLSHFLGKKVPYL